jgi:hypothetical protein
MAASDRGNGGLFAVHSAVVGTVMVDGMAKEVARRAATAVPAVAARDLPAAGSLGVGMAGAAEHVARAGYVARVIEWERFEPARQPAQWLCEALAETSPRARVELCLALAYDEPLEKPSPRDVRAVSWRIPGPGGHVRHELALRAIAAAAGGRLELKRCWMFGFLLRCCEDAPQP